MPNPPNDRYDAARPPVPTAGARRPSPTIPDNVPRPGRPPWWDRLDLAVAVFMQRHGMRLLRISLGVVYIWFGILKPFHLSPADVLVTRTVAWMPVSIRHVFVPLLGWWEVAIGVGLLFRRFLRAALLLLFLQMPGTALPLVLLPHLCFTHFPYGLTLEGQYIIKNLTLISAAIVVGGTVRFGARRRDQRQVTLML
jgi:uncharacterized membrane protein YkgB